MHNVLRKMVTPLASLSCRELAPVVVPVPYQVAPSTRIAEVIALMDVGGSANPLVREEGLQPLHTPASGCVLVVENEHLVGIVTAWSLMCLSVSGGDWQDRAIATVMTAPVQTLPISALVDVTVPQALFERYQLHHLPLVDDQGQVVGLVTAASLWEALSANELLQSFTVNTGIREAFDPLSAGIAQAPASATLAAVVQMMVAQKIRAVAIAAEPPSFPHAAGTNGSLFHPSQSPSPVGLITAQEIVQGLALGVDLATVPVGAVMAAPVTIDAGASLQTAQEMMRTQQVQQLIITQGEGAVVGLVTPEALLHALHPQALAQRQATLHQTLQAELLARQRAEAELEEQRTLLRTVIDTTPNKLFVKDWNGRILLANRAVADYYNVTVENLIGHYDRDFLADPALADQFMAENRAVIDTQQPLFIPEEKSTPPNGHEHWLQWQKYPITVPGTNIPAVLGVGVDITSHKEAQTVLRQYERVVSATTDGIALLDRNYVYRLVNHVYLDWHEKRRDEIVGYSVAELLGESVFEELVRPRLDRCLAGAVEQYEAWFDYKHGGKRFVRITYAPYVEIDHTIAGIVVTTHDMTALKLTEEALQEREQFLRSIYEGVDQCIFTVDVLADGEFRLFSFNPAAERLTGQTTAQMRGKLAGSQVRQRYLDCVQAGAPMTYEECLTFQNQPSWWLTTLTPLRDAESRIYRLVGTSINITQRKQAEIQLDMQNAILERIAKAEPLATILDELLRAMEVQLGDALCSIMLCDRTGTTLHAAPAPQLPIAYLQAIDGIPIQEGVGSCGTAAFRREPVIVADTTTDPLWQNFQDLPETYGFRACWSFPIAASDGRLLGTFGVYYRDCRTPQPPQVERITQAAHLAGIAIEREQATQALEQLNQDLEARVAERTTDLQAANLQLQHLGERLYLAVKSASLGIWEIDLVNNISIWDEQMYVLYGIQGGQLEDDYPAWLNYLYPDDRPLAEADAQQALQGEKDYESEFRVIHPDGSIRHLKAYGRVQWDDAGTPLRMLGVSFDITARKEMELALRESEERWQLALKGSNDGIWDWNLITQRVFYSSRWKAMRGYADHEIGDRPEEWSSRIHPDDYDRVIAATQAHLRGETEFYGIEYRTQHKDGSFFWILDRGQAWRDASGRAVRMSGSHTDISDRKQAEMALQASETRYRQIVETQTEFVIRSTPETTITFANAAICRALGRSPEEIIGRAWDEFVPATHLPTLHAKIAALSPEHPTFENINSDYRADGQLGWTQWVNLGIFNHQGELIEIQSVGRDITQLRFTEDALRQSEERFRGAFANTAIGMSLVSPRGRFLKANAALCNFLGYREADLMELTFHNISHPDDLAADLALSQQTLEGAIDHYHLEKRFITKQGEVVWGCLSVSLVRDGQGQPLYFVSQTQDISDRKQAEAELQISRDLREAIYNESTDALFLVDPQTLRTLDCNQRAADLFEVDDRSELIDIEGRFLQRYPFSDEELAEITADMERHGFWSRELEYVTRRGRIFWGNIAAKPITVAGRTMNLVRLTDISDRKQSEIALQTSETRFRRVFESSVVGMIFANFDGQIVDANDRFLEIVGYSRADLEAGLLRWDTMTPAEYAALDQEIIVQLRQYGQVSPREKEYYRKDGSRVSVLLGVAVLPNTTDQTVCVVVDMSDRKRLEQEQQRMVTILEGSTDYIGMSDAVSGHVIWNNRAIKELCGIESDAAMVQRTPAAYHPQWAMEILQEQAVPAAIAHGSWMGETALIDAQGQEVPVSQLLLAHRSPQGEVEFFSAIMRDMRIHKAYEQQLEQTNAELRRATRLKDEFLANMSHELRTPLNAILGMSEGLQEEILGEINDQQRKAIATIETSGQHLLELINDILDLSKVSAGKLELSPSDVSVSYLCSSSLVFVKQQALHKQIHLTASLPPNLDPISVDERRLRQVLVNLLTNAVKFTPSQGQVTLKVWHSLSEPPNPATTEPPLANFDLDPQAFPTPPDGHTWLLISVTDTGIGIAPHDQTRLFQPFIQVDSSLSRHYEGTGLGLALVKQIVELHGGFVHLASALGQGSCFTIGLPYRESPPFPLPNDPPAPSPETSPSEPQTGRSPIDPMSASNPVPPFLQVVQGAAIGRHQPLILLAEDNQDNIDTVSSYLEVYGYRLVLANNGQEAIDLAQTHHPELILMDIQMPTMDGLEAIRAIRQTPQMDQIPIIAVTALAMVGDRERCLEAGASMYLTKPLKLKQLVMSIQELLT